MTHRTAVVPGDAGWNSVAGLMRRVWPAVHVATLPWRDVVRAHADQRVLTFDQSGEVVGHVGLYFRDGTWNDRLVKLAGIGDVATRDDRRRVATRDDRRRQGIAHAGMQRAAQAMAEVDFGLLFCEPRHETLYQSLGWHRFEGIVYAEQPAGRVRFDVIEARVLDRNLAPSHGVLDLCGLPW